MSTSNTVPAGKSPAEECRLGDRFSMENSAEFHVAPTKNHRIINQELFYWYINHRIFNIPIILDLDTDMSKNPH
jgi:hypothetical protein